VLGIKLSYKILAFYQAETFKGQKIQIHPDGKRGTVLQDGIFVPVGVRDFPVGISRKELEKGCWFERQFGDIQVHVRGCGGAPLAREASYEQFPTLAQQFPQIQIGALDPFDLTLTPAYDFDENWNRDLAQNKETFVKQAIDNVGIPAFFTGLATWGPHPLIKGIGIAGGLAWACYQAIRTDSEIASLSSEIEELKSRPDIDEDLIFEKASKLTKKVIVMAQDQENEISDSPSTESEQTAMERMEDLASILIEADTDKREAVTEAARQSRDSLFQLSMVAAHTAVDLTAQIAAFSRKPKLAYKVSVVGGNTLKIFDAGDKLWKSSLSSVTTRSSNLSKILQVVPYVGDIASAILSIASLARSSGPSSEKIIITALTAHISTVREEMHERFDRSEQLLSAIHQNMLTGFAQLQTKVDIVDQHVITSYQAIDTAIRGAVEFHLADGIGNALNTPAVMRDQIIGFITRLQTWATTHAFNALITGADKSFSTPSQIVTELQNNEHNLESRIGYLAKLMGMTGRLPANPTAWAMAADAIMQIRSVKLSPESHSAIYLNAEGLEQFKNLLATGTQLRAFIKRIQLNRTFFERLFTDYRAAAETISRYSASNIQAALSGNDSNPELNAALEDLEKNYLLLNLALYFGFNASYMTDHLFRSLFIPDVFYGHRLIGRDDIRTMVQRTDVQQGHSGRVLSELSNKVTALNTMVFAKMEALPTDETTSEHRDDYGLVGFIMRKLCAFGQQYYSRRDGDEEWNTQVEDFWDPEMIGQRGPILQVAIQAPEVIDPAIYRTEPRKRAFSGEQGDVVPHITRIDGAGERVIGQWTIAQKAVPNTPTTATFMSHKGNNPDFAGPAPAGFIHREGWHVGNKHNTSKRSYIQIPAKTEFKVSQEGIDPQSIELSANFSGHRFTYKPLSFDIKGSVLAICLRSNPFEFTREKGEQTNHGYRCAKSIYTSQDRSRIIFWDLTTKTQINQIDFGTAKDYPTKIGFSGHDLYVEYNNGTTKKIWEFQ
jgi:hypothetical protein